jgi:hypothetical protein
MLNKSSSVKSRIPFSSRSIGVVMASALPLGVLLLLVALAAGTAASAELENGTVTGGATVVADSAASGGKAVKFGSATLAPTPAPANTPVPTPKPTTKPPTPTPTPVTQSCANPSHTLAMSASNPQAGITLSGFYLTNDNWNAANYQVSQTMYICDYNNWYAIANMNNNTHDGAVKTYPNVHKDFNNTRINSYSAIASSFSEAGPHVGIYEWAYDIWLNGVATNGSTEVMIWNDNFGQTPSGTVQETYSLGGRTYKVYKSGTYIAFVDQSNTTAGTVDLLAIFKHVMAKGWISATSTLGQIDYGPELVSTNSTNAKFVVNNFSLTTQ